MSERKDRLIQTRVPRQLESTLKQEAQRQGTTVSELVREILEDALDLVDDVVADVDSIVNDAVALGRQVAAGAKRVAATARGRAPGRPRADGDLANVDAWNEVVLNRELQCSRCSAVLAKGERAFTGIGDSDQPRAWLCAACRAEV
ncbi:MAG: hypothetical protein O7A09_08235 [Proteobacteria bacterium]|nr:hypothetical protein [Pseudomonadota bacterium]MCZ6784015.1 hypothetical protein [Pseudomonadota bacterium]